MKAFAEWVFCWTSNARFAEMNNLVQNPSALARLKDGIVAEVEKFGWDGVDFDVENIGASSPPAREKIRDCWSAFVGSLADALHAKGKLLVVTVPGRWADEDRLFLPQTYAHDWRAIGAKADLVPAMCYDDKGNLPIALQQRIIDYAKATYRVPSPQRGPALKQAIAFFVRCRTGHVLCFSTLEDDYERAWAEALEPILASFGFFPAADGGLTP